MSTDDNSAIIQFMMWQPPTLYTTTHIDFDAAAPTLHVYTRLRAEQWHLTIIEQVQFRAGLVQLSPGPLLVVAALLPGRTDDLVSSFAVNYSSIAGPQEAACLASQPDLTWHFVTEAGYHGGIVRPNPALLPAKGLIEGATRRSPASTLAFELARAEIRARFPTAKTLWEGLG